MPEKQIKYKSRINIDLDDRHTAMVDYLKHEYGLTYSAELVRLLIKEAYDKAKGPYALRKAQI